MKNKISSIELKEKREALAFELRKLDAEIETATRKEEQERIDKINNIKTKCFLSELKLLNPNVDFKITSCRIELETTHYIFKCAPAEVNSKNWNITILDKHRYKQDKHVVRECEIEGTLYQAFKNNISETLLDYEENDYAGVG